MAVGHAVVVGVDVFADVVCRERDRIVEESGGRIKGAAKNIARGEALRRRCRPANKDIPAHFRSRLREVALARVEHRIRKLLANNAVKAYALNDVNLGGIGEKRRVCRDRRYS